MSGGWTLSALRYASRMTTRSDVFLRYDQYGEPDGPQEMAYYLWVLRNGSQTIVSSSGQGRWRPGRSLPRTSSPMRCSVSRTGPAPAR